MHPDGDVTACSADGSSDRADLIVDPDGAGSTVGRARPLPADLYDRTADAELPLRESGPDGMGGGS